MRIAVDARQIYRPERRGIGKTLVPLYQALAAAHPAWRFYLVHQQPVAVPELAARNVVPVRLDPPGAYRADAWTRVVLPAAAWALRADVLHCPANVGPTLSPVPVALTVHDLIPTSEADDGGRWLARVRESAKSAGVLMTATEYTRTAIAAALALDRGRIAVTPWAASRSMRPVSDAGELARVRARYGVRPGEEYLFGFGAVDPRKNTARVIRAFAGLPPDLRRSRRLVLVGIQPEGLTDFRRLAQECGVAGAVTLAPFAPEGDLPALVSGAVLVAFPSQSEGFGLPLLDAFACGTPVLTGDRTSLPEVAGGAAHPCDPTSDESVRAGLAALLADPDLRRRYADSGLARAREFDWGRTAETVAGLFRGVATGRAGARPRPVPAAANVRGTDRFVIVLVDYNGLADTRRCLESLAQMTERAAVVVVDNASRVDVAAALATEFPGVHFLRSPVNGGWAGGNNLGVRRALDRGAEWVILLNNDTTVTPDFLIRLKAAAEAADGFGALGPVIRFMEPPCEVQTDGVVFNRPRQAGFFQRAPVPLATADPPRVAEVDIVNGCCLMARREAILAAGPIDEAFFLIHEESDWCLRIQAAGFRNGVIAEALVYHKGSSSFKREGKRLQRYFDARNLVRLLVKHRRRRSGRRLSAGLAHHLTYCYHRYAIEREGGFDDSAEAIVEGLYDALAGHWGPHSTRPRPGLGVVRLAFRLAFALQAAVRRG